MLRVSVGKFTSYTPGIALIFGGSPNFALPDAIYSVLVDTLGINSDDNWIPCDVTQNIVFTVGGLDLILTPDEYIIKDQNGKCYFMGYNAADDELFDDNQFALPNTLFRKRCLLFDLEKKQIFFADRTDK